VTTHFFKLNPAFFKLRQTVLLVEVIYRLPKPFVLSASMRDTGVIKQFVLFTPKMKLIVLSLTRVKPKGNSFGSHFFDFSVSSRLIRDKDTSV